MTVGGRGRLHQTAIEGRRSRAQVDVAGKVDLELHQLLEGRAGGVEAEQEGVEGPGGLGREIAFGDHLAACVASVLDADAQRPGAGGAGSPG